jgi:Domain of unknown function (DUF4386)
LPTLTTEKKVTKTISEEDRKTARVAGVLFIIATAASLLSLPFLAPINASNYLVSVSANANQVLTGAFIAFIAAVASASIAISLYPVLKRYNEGLALGAVGLRLIEGMLYIVGVAGLVLLLTLSQQFVKAGAPNSSYFQTLGVLLLAGYHWVGNSGALLAFSLGALTYYYIFYQTKLVPRWLSIWGLLAAALCLVAAMSVMFNLIGAFSTAQIVLALPIAVQEMVLAVWLIIKGFNTSAFASRPSKDILTP